MFRSRTQQDLFCSYPSPTPPSRGLFLSDVCNDCTVYALGDIERAASTRGCRACAGMRGVGQNTDNRMHLRRTKIILRLCRDCAVSLAMLLTQVECTHGDAAVSEACALESARMRTHCSVGCTHALVEVRTDVIEEATTSCLLCVCAAILQFGTRANDRASY